MKALLTAILALALIPFASFAAEEVKHDEAAKEEHHKDHKDHKDHDGHHHDEKHEDKK